ncbi:MAG: LamG domain-containing protein [Planctomycetaceae bacterium]|nr:MAG: LamG domain-containing protein [Planctomycetaceae bacterium]
MTYDNTGTTISEATLTLDQNWTTSGIKSLSLYFRGAAGNKGQLYVKIGSQPQNAAAGGPINNARVLYEGAAGDIAATQWVPWNIDLAAVGTNLSQVTSLTIGVEGAGAKGILYVDDIRIYPKTPELLTPVDPGKTGLLAEYLFDNGANDSSGKGHHGTLLDNAQVADSFLLLDGVDDAVAIPRLGGANAAFTRCTYSMWMNSVRDPATAGIIGGINSNNWTTGGIHCKLYNGRANAGINALAGGDMNGRTVVKPDEWVHLALTVSDTVAILYLNGQAEASRGVTTPLTMFLGNGSIGAWNNNSDIQRELTGKMDDVRIYDRAVSEAELLWLAGKRAPVHKPF